MAKYTFISVSEIQSKYGWSRADIYRLASTYHWSSSTSIYRNQQVYYRADQVEKVAQATRQDDTVRYTQTAPRVQFLRGGFDPNGDES